MESVAFWAVIVAVIFLILFALWVEVDIGGDWEEEDSA